MRILAWPAFGVGQDNPYTRLLYGAMHGVHVEDFTGWRALLRHYDIFHVHWPEYYVAHPNPIKAIVGTMLLIGCIYSLRLRGTKVVWTVHNLASHDYRRPWLEQRFWDLFTRLVDGFVAWTPAGLSQAREQFPPLREVLGFVVPHGLIYRDAYPNSVSRLDARQRFRLGSHQRVVLFLGIIAKYKSVPTLTRVFRNLRDPDAHLLIAGNFATGEDEAEIRNIADGDPRIDIHPGYVPPNDLQFYLNAADLVVLPFRQILNSGSALLALSFDKPVLVPALGAMPELQSTFGAEWVRTYEGELTPAELERALDWAIKVQRPRMHPASSPSWEEIAQRTQEAYTRVLLG